MRSARTGSSAPAEREEFVKLFTDVLEAAYVGKIEKYSGEKVTRTQFNNIIQTASYQDLVKRMRAKDVSAPEGSRGRRS